MSDTPTAVQLVDLIISMQRKLRSQAGDPWPDSPLSQAQAELVRLVRREPGVTVAGAAARLGLAPNTISTLVTRLVENDVLLRETDRRDARVVRLRLTASANRRVQRWRDRRSSYVDDLLETLPVREQEQIRRAVPALEHLLQVMESGRA